ncbi:TRAP transporter small permease subunit [Simiduia aestuariiviva]|uniref:TRAP transporter small permease protein n=1 Tax=Simiduia aestuariiviva TaxID=1510459 RepID=A0A839UWV4_9GAMM|nr:TRAP transporter small permease subunit [Simiduia aestuariiviva]MBB3169847.1 TRAP-type mannitol/chloroaromatic compound transport system permease small subunit [Simiduia aestuariiviva]
MSDSESRPLGQGLIALQFALQSGTRRLGRWVAWLTLAMVLITCLIVLLRYGFNVGSVALQEGLIYLHATVFLLALAYTADEDQQVRVDIFYRRFSPTAQAWINCLGALLFLLPFACLMFWVTWPFFTNALAIREGSGEAGGLPFVYLLKGLLPLSALSLIILAIGQVAGNLGRLMQSYGGQSHD